MQPSSVIFLVLLSELGEPLGLGQPSTPSPRKDRRSHDKIRLDHSSEQLRTPDDAQQVCTESERFLMTCHENAEKLLLVY